jgi:hypothetical protein
MSNLKKTLEEEYLINNVFKLIMESVGINEEIKVTDNMQEFYEINFSEVIGLPTKEDATNPQNIQRLKRIFNFTELERAEDRIKKINSKLIELSEKSSKAVSIENIPEIMTSLEVVTMFYKIVNSQRLGAESVSSQQAGFIMEYLFAMIVAGDIPPGNPIPDVVVKKEDGLIKLYSLKTYREKSYTFGGSFVNLLKAFAGTDKNMNAMGGLSPSEPIDSVVYIVFRKLEDKGSREVVSIEMTEARVTLGPTNEELAEYNIFDFVEASELAKITTQGYNVEELKQLCYKARELPMNSDERKKIFKIILDHFARGQFKVKYRNKLRVVDTLHVSNAAALMMLNNNAELIGQTVFKAMEDLKVLNESFERYFRGQGDPKQNVAVTSEKSKNIYDLSVDMQKTIQ